MAPRSAASRPATMRSKVVLPQPDGPSSDMNSPAATLRSTPPSTVMPPKAFSAPATSRNESEVTTRPLDYIAMSRSQRLTQSARLSATNFQSMPKMVALVGAPAGTGVSLLVGSEKVATDSLVWTSGPIISLM